MSGQDFIIDVGTGDGKTLCMIIPCLVRKREVLIQSLDLVILITITHIYFSRRIVRNFYVAGAPIK